MKSLSYRVGQIVGQLVSLFALMLCLMGIVYLAAFLWQHLTMPMFWFAVGLFIGILALALGSMVAERRRESRPVGHWCMECQQWAFPAHDHRPMSERRVQ